MIRRSDMPLTRAGSHPRGLTLYGITAPLRSKDSRVWIEVAQLRMPKEEFHPWLASSPSPSLLADEFCEDVVSDRLDFTLRQTRRMRIACCVVAEILPLQPVAVRILVSVFVEVRHFGPRPPAGDHLD